MYVYMCVSGLQLTSAIPVRQQGNDCSSVPDRNVDKSKLETRLGFADKASRKFVCVSLYHIVLLATLILLLQIMTQVDIQ